MAIGLARMMGYNFPNNFDYPYQAASITQFWRRWHISLSTWLRNYLYIPLGGNRGGKILTYRNLFLTMLLGGLWHGASWNFVLWGGLHGLALALHKAFASDETPRGSSSLQRLIPSWLLTQLFVLLCWVPFRLPHFGETLEVYSAFVGLRDDSGLKPYAINYWFLVLPLAADTLLGKRDLSFLGKLIRWIPEAKRVPASCFLIGIIFAVVLTMMNMKVSPFIYFQF